MTSFARAIGALLAEAAEQTDADLLLHGSADWSVHPTDSLRISA